ncbi:MAG: tetratricopeptide repeat protein [Bacteroidota bacterium]|nr:tetratricopeptide repeat protein [Bacteroidota bacterium]
MNKPEEQYPYSEIVQRYKKMLKADKHVYFDISELEEIIDYFLEKQDFEGCEKAISYARRLHKHSTELSLKKAQLLIDKQDYNQAESLLVELSSSMGGKPDLYFLYGYMYVKTDRLEDAAEAFAQFVHLTSDKKAESHSSVAFTYVQAGYYDEAVSHLKQAEKADPESSYVLYESAYCYEKIGDFEKSIHYYEQFLKEQPFSSNVWYNLGLVYELDQKPEKAIEAYDFALALKPKFELAHSNKGNVELSEGKYGNALQTFENLLKFYPSSKAAFSGVADAYRFMADYEQALEYYYKALKIDKYYLPTIYGIALVYFEKDNNFEGLNYVLRALKQDKNNPNYNFLAGLFFDRLEYFDKAEVAFVKSLEADPFRPQVWISFSDIYVETEAEKAIKLLVEAGSILPESEDIFYRLTAIYYQLKKYEKAEQTLRTALNINEDRLAEFLEEFPQIRKVERLKKLTDTKNMNLE